MKFKSILSQYFPGAIAESAFVKRSVEVLEPHGFGDHSAIACIAMCRDEVCTPLHTEVQRRWGEAFNMTSLAGVPLCGRTGFAAAHAHSPNPSQRERYVYYCMAHIGVGADGTFGECTRPGRDEVSKACGALVALHAELESSEVALEHDPYVVVNGVRHELSLSAGERESSAA